MADGIEFAVLGPVTATRGGRPIVLDHQQRALLATLLVAFPHSVDIERIAAQVRHTPRGSGDGQVRSGTDPLTRALEGLAGRLAGGGDAVLVREDGRYRLAVPQDAVDAVRFVNEVRSGDAMAAREPDAAANAYRTGLRLWRGLAYAGIPASALDETAFVETAVADLTARRFEARLSLAQALLDSGQSASAAGEAESLVADHPFDERGWELLVLGLARSGRHAQAQASLRRCRAVTDERLGSEIGVGLRRLETAIGGQDSVYVDAAHVSPSPRVRGSNLLLPRTRLVDRTSDVASIMRMLGEQPVVTLVGPDGAGKTRLAVEVCRRWTAADGPWIVDLTKVSDGALIPSTIATLLALPGVGSASHLATVLAPRSCVLVLDSCDHVAGYTADVVRAVVTRCPDIRVLVTGRAPLGIENESVYEVAPLPVDGAALELFADRAVGVDATWTVTERSEPAVRAICREVEGLPLGIELAAAQLRFRSEQQIAEGLAEYFTRLHGRPMPQLGPRGRLWDTINWSYHLLPDCEARLLRRVAVFAGSFDLEGAFAMSVLGKPDEVTRVLTALVRRGLVRVVPGSSPVRYRMLATIRQFARGQRDEAESIAVRAAHRQFVAARVASVSAALRSARAWRAIAVLTQDQAEYRAALESSFDVGDAHFALDLAGQLAFFWYRTGNIGEGLKFLRTALELVAGDWRPPEARVMARALDGVASLSFLTGDVAAAEDAVRQAVPLWEEIGEAAEVAREETWRAYFVAVQGRPEAGMVQARDAVGLVADDPDAGWIEAEARTVLGMLLRSVGQIDAARDELRAAVRAGERSGNRWAVTSSTWGLMKSAADRGDVERALATMKVLRADLEGEDDVVSWLVMIHSTAAVLASAGRPTDGAVLIGAVDALGAQSGFLPAWMDTVDGPIEAATVQDALDDEEFAQYASAGSHLTREQVNRLVGELVDGPTPGTP